MGAGRFSTGTCEWLRERRGSSQKGLLPEQAHGVCELLHLMAGLIYVCIFSEYGFVRMLLDTVMPVIPVGL